MSDEDLEQDELEGGAEDDGEELAAADDGVADDSEDSDSDVPVKAGKKAKAAVDIDELPSVEAKQKERDALERKARQLETASQLNQWLASSELKPPD